MTEAKLPKLLVVLLFGAIILGSALRFFALGAESYWYDEVFAVRLAGQSFGEVLAAEKFNPPLYFLTLHFWLKLVGSNAEEPVRLLSALFGLFSLPLAYLVIKELAGKAVALAVVAYMSISSFHIFFAQEAKTYTLHLVVTLASSWVFWRIFKGKRSLGFYSALVGLNVLALYAHYYSVFFVAAQNLYFVLQFRKFKDQLVPWLSAQVAILVLYAPWLENMLAAADSGGQERRYFLLKIPQAFFSLLLGDTLVPMDEAAVLNIRDTLAGHWYYLALGLVVFLPLLVTAIKKFSLRDERISFLVVMALAPVGMAALISLRIMLFEERYFFFTTPYLYCLVVLAVFSVSRQRAALVCLLVGLLFLSTYNYFTHPRFGKDQWREVVSYVESNLQPGDKMLILPNYLDICWEHYSTKEVPTMKVTYQKEGTKGLGWEEVREFGLEAERLWYVRSFLRDTSQVEWFQKRFAQDKKIYFPKDKGIEVYLFSGLR